MPGFGGAADPTVAGRTQVDLVQLRCCWGADWGGAGGSHGPLGSTSCFPTDTGTH